jgi:alpha-L-rhamnosidase
MKMHYPVPLSQSSRFTKILLVLLLLAAPFYPALLDTASAQEPAERPKWKAKWIAHPTASLKDPEVFHFRKVVHLSARPGKFIVHVSADNRFILYVNGKRIGEGPARGDLAHWRYETFDLAPALQAGDNVLAATVWQFSIYAPQAQMSDRTGFLLEGDSATEAAANTDETWQAEEEPGHTPLERESSGLYFYRAMGSGEHIDASLYDWSWKAAASPSSHWVAARGAIRESIYPDGSQASSRYEGPNTQWMLVPDTLPPMEYTEVPAGKVVRTDLPAAQGFPQNPATVPAHAHVKILLDRATLITAYPELTTSGGKGSHIRATYTEALYDARQKRGNRNEVGTRQALGLYDEFLPDGGSNRVFMPLWWRVWRYLELDIETADEPLQLNGMRAYFTAYPFEERAKFQSSDPELSQIWQICWRADRLDAHETYMDTPYWEQLQYIGDTRIQALMSYVVSGDDRLARQALRAFDSSRTPEGFTQSRYPTSLPQYIPPFSLLYVNMLHDYWMYRPGKSLVTELLPGTHGIFEWFFRHQTEDGFLSPLPYWTFVDSPAGTREFPPKDGDGKSAVLTLQFLGALRDAADLEDALGDKTLAAAYRKRAQFVAEAVYGRCWNAKYGLLADTPAQTSYSQHANVLAVLLDVIPPAQQIMVMKRILAPDLNTEVSPSEPNLAHVSYYFQFYLSRALDHAGLGDEYLELLKPWRGMLALGLTATPEFPEPTRSDSHAWSAHPIYDFMTTVAGIHSDAPGFARVRITPHLGTLEFLDLAMPHPNGMIQASYRKKGTGMDASITLPDGLAGVLVWHGTEYPLHSGRETFQLK